MFNRLFTQLSILLIPAAFVAIMCAGPGSLMISIFYRDFFRVTEKVVCPQTGKAEVRTVGTSRGGQNFEMYCIDLEGQRSKDDVVGWSIALLFVIYFVVFYLVAIIVIIPRLNEPASTSESRATIKHASPFIDSQVRDLLAIGNKIEAIKIVRQATQMSLAEAKTYVETLARTKISLINDRSSIPMDVVPEIEIADIVGSIKPELKNKILTLIERDQKALAIQIVKDDLGVSLHAAKRYVEKLSGGMSLLDTESNPEEQLAKLRELKKMLDEKLITPAEYEAKKTEIIADL